MWNFDNRKSLSENDSYIIELTGNLGKGEIYGNAEFVDDGVNNKALNFDGVDDFVILDFIDDISINKNYTISMWVKVINCSTEDYS